jgi:diacylglycerol O-acyltransferase
VSRLGELGLIAAGRLVGMPPVPPIPAGRVIELAGRGATYVVDTGAVASARGGDAPVVFLLHALACTGLLTWYPCLDALSHRYRLVIFDQRGHGQGIRSARFDVDDCADDVAAVADALDVDTFVAAGYSMGSLVAQNVWLRHRDRVDGLVLGATTTHFAATPRRQRMVTTVGARLAAAGATRPRRIAVEALDQSVDDRWAWRQFRATTAAEVAAVGSVLARFDSRAWIDDVDVPTAVVVTARDRLIPPARQRDLARRISGATVYEVDAGHAACVLAAARFRPAMLAATASVSSRTGSVETTPAPP